MNKVKPTPYTVKRIGSARLVAEMSPVFDLIKMENGRFGYSKIDADFTRRHDYYFDCFLLDNGYYFTIPDISDDPVVIYDHSVPDDPFGEDIPDPYLLMQDAITTLNGGGDDPGAHAYDMIDMLYYDIYDDHDLQIISNAKARYLCCTLSTFLDISYFERGDDAEIKIKGIQKDICGFSDMLIDLGFLPRVTITNSTNHFMGYVEDYINAGYFRDDGFAFGEAVLKSYDENIAHIDWFDHYDLNH